MLLLRFPPKLGDPSRQLFLSAIEHHQGSGLEDPSHTANITVRCKPPRQLRGARPSSNSDAARALLALISVLQNKRLGFCLHLISHLQQISWIRFRATAHSIICA